MGLGGSRQVEKRGSPGDQNSMKKSREEMEFPIGLAVKDSVLSLLLLGLFSSLALELPYATSGAKGKKKKVESGKVQAI